MAYRVADTVLLFADAPLLAGLEKGASARPSPCGAGAFLTFEAGHVAARHTHTVGRIEDLRRLVALYRNEPFWMVPFTGEDLAAVPPETQWLLAERADGRFVLVVPLLDAPSRYALRGSKDGLVVVGETGDATVAVRGGRALYVACGDDPHRMMKDGARAVAVELGTTRLRTEKPLPAHVDAFGWCTWDAFYHEVDEAKVREGLRSFAAIGVTPRFLVLDDGWQSEAAVPTGERRLTALEPNGKFGGDLRPTVAAAREHGVRHVFVWHAILGYWSGVDGSKLPGYGVREVARAYGPDHLAHFPEVNFKWWGALCGAVPAEHIHRFYNDYHRSLRAQGVDGVKVDNQANLEALAHGLGCGGRVAYVRTCREALEGSAQVHFGGALLNCMSCGNDTFYLSPASNLIRTSTDFWPKKPESHGLHLHTNALVCLWFGEFQHGDWDMFWSQHPAGAYHAAGRAVSGSPVYVSDKPGQHDAALLRKLVLSDGSVARCDAPGVIARDCLMRDPRREDVLLKIVNTAGGAGLVGVFHAQYHADAAERVTLRGAVRASDVPGLAGERFAAFLHNAGVRRVVGRDEGLALALDEGGYELATFAPVVDGVAVVGLADKFASPAAVRSRRSDGDAVRLELRDGGALLVWSARPLACATAAGVAVPVRDLGDGFREFGVPASGPVEAVLTPG